MSNNWENEPSLDYFELRRRHEEYKNSQRKAQEQPEAEAPADEPAQPEVEPAAAEAGGAVEDAQDVFQPDAVDAEDIAEDLDEVYPADEDGDGDGDAGNDNPNPFDSFISAFHGLRSRFGKGRARRADEEDDEEYEDEELDDGEEPRPVRDLPEDGGEALDIEDLPEDMPDRSAGEDGGNAPDDTGDDVPEDEDRPEETGGFKKFLRLFVVPVDESERKPRPEDGEDEEDWDDDEAPSDQWDAAGGQPEDEQQTAEDIEGGLDMSDQNNVNAEVASQLAADLETPGLSRRERRELAMRQAAEKAAAEAEQAAETAEQKAETLFADKPLEADAVADVAEGIVEIAPAKEAADSPVDEPTREYKAVSKSKYDPFIEQEKPESSDEDDEDEEDEKPVRRGLFGRRRKVEEPEEEDDEDEDEDEEEEEDRPRRGLFGRRRKAEEEDEDDDEDEDEEDEKPARGRRRRYEEDDEYDEYDEDDDSYDDEDEYDDEDDDDYEGDEEEGTSFGHVLLGILKGFLTALVLLLFVVVVLNVLNIFNVIRLDSLASRMPTKMVDVFLPSQNMKQKINVEAEINPAPAVQQIPAAEESQLPDTQAEAEPVGEAPVEEEPAEEAPVEEAPVEEDSDTVAVG